MRFDRSVVLAALTALHWLPSTSAAVLGKDAHINTSIYARGKTGDFRNEAYMGTWQVYPTGGEKMPADTLDPTRANQLTHLLYAFARIDEHGKLVSSAQTLNIQEYPGKLQMINDPSCIGKGIDPLMAQHVCKDYFIDQIWEMKKENPNLKVLLAIGGWTFSGGDLPDNQKGHNDFAIFHNLDAQEIYDSFTRSAFELVKEFKFDGVTLDYEYPQDKEGYQNSGKAYTKLLTELRKTFPADQNWVIGTAVGVDPKKHGVESDEKIEWGELKDVLDIVHIMAYDFAGGDFVLPDEQKYVSHQSNLNSYEAISGNTWSGSKGMTFLDKFEFDRKKISLGIPAYGRSFKCEPQPCKLNDRYAGPGENKPAETNGGTWKYYEILKANPKAPPYDPGTTIGYDSKTVGTTFVTTEGDFVSYDDIQSTKAKTDWVINAGFGGVFYWDVGGDAESSNENSLIKTSYDLLKTAGGGLKQDPQAIPITQEDIDTKKAPQVAQQGTGPATPGSGPAQSGNGATPPVAPAPVAPAPVAPAAQQG